jgi:PAS domain S-box-containing protein
MVDFDPEGELHFHRIFEAAGVAILITNAEGSFVESNSAGVELLGYSAEQLRGMSIRDVTHPEDLPECEALYAELIHGKRSHYKIEKRFLRGDGAVIWSVLTVSRLPRNEGPQFAIGIVENITERKRAEEALQASREHLEASVRASNTGLWDWNLRTNEVYYSPEWKSLLGYEEHEISSRLEETFNRFHPDDRQRTIAAILAFLRDPGPSFETECRLRHKDGSYRWILSRASVLRGADGRPYRMLGAHLDITEQKRTEERLREYEKAVEGLQEMILVIDRDYRYLIANRAYLTYRDLTGEQVIGHAIPDFMGREFFQTVAKPRLDECFQGRIVKYEKKYSFHA